MCEGDNPGSHTIQIRSSNLLLSPRYKFKLTQNLTFLLGSHHTKMELVLSSNICIYYVTNNMI